MKCIKFSLSLFILIYFSPTLVEAQSATIASGGNASGTGGNASFTVGQLLYTTNTGSTGTVSHGVQQPYEISVISAIEYTEGINIECTVYPNPTRGKAKLVISTKDFYNLRYQLYDIGGLRLLEKKVDSEETEIQMDNLRPSTYFLKVLSGNKEIKTFKIIKN